MRLPWRVRHPARTRDAATARDRRAASELRRNVHWAAPRLTCACPLCLLLPPGARRRAVAHSARRTASWSSRPDPSSAFGPAACFLLRRSYSPVLSPPNCSRSSRPDPSSAFGPAARFLLRRLILSSAPIVAWSARAACDGRHTAGRRRARLSGRRNGVTCASSRMTRPTNARAPSNRSAGVPRGHVHGVVAQARIPSRHTAIGVLPQARARCAARCRSRDLGSPERAIPLPFR